MRREQLSELLEQVARGELDVTRALSRLSLPDSESLPFATIDHHRAIRQGYPEVIFGSGKTTDQIIAIAERLAGHGDGFLATRVDTSAHAALQSRFPGVEINELGRTAYLAPETPPPAGRGTILVVTAGTSDLPVAEEAAVTASA